MAWTAPISYVSGAVATSAGMNTYVKSNLAYLMSLLDGTGGAVTVTVPGQLNFVNDALFHAEKASGINPSFLFDTQDALVYERSTNTLQVYINNLIKLALDANGKLTGAGFYDSGEFSLAASGGSITLSHGLAAKPRVYAGRWGNSTGDVNLTKPVLLRETFEVYIQQFSDTTITVVNLETATRYIRIFAML